MEQEQKEERKHYDGKERKIKKTKKKCMMGITLQQCLTFFSSKILSIKSCSEAHYRKQTNGELC